MQWNEFLRLKEGQCPSFYFIFKLSPIIIIELNLSFKKEVFMKISKLFILSFMTVFVLAGCASNQAANQLKSSSKMVYETTMDTAAFNSAESVSDIAEVSNQEKPVITENKKSISGSEISTDLTVEERKLIRTISIDMETTKFDETVVTLSNTIRSLGGYLESSGISGNSIDEEKLRYANLEIRIPQMKADEFLALTGQYGNITYKNETISDITLQYADTEDHIKTLEIEQGRLWILLEKADSIETIIAIEERLSNIRYELESYRTQLKLYDNKVEYSTIHLTIQEVKIYTSQSEDGIGTKILNGFEKNFNFLVSTVIGIIVWVLAHTPVLIILVVVGYMSIKIIKATKRRIQIKSKKNKQQQKKSDTNEKDT